MEAHGSCWEGLSSHMRVCCHPVSHIFWTTSHCDHDWAEMPVYGCQSIWLYPWHQVREVPQISPASLHMLVKPHTRIMITFLQ